MVSHPLSILVGAHYSRRDLNGQVGVLVDRLRYVERRLFEEVLQKLRDDRVAVLYIKGVVLLEF